MTERRPLADYEIAEVQEYLLRGVVPIDPIDTLLRLIDTIDVLEDRLGEIEKRVDAIVDELEVGRTA